MKDEAAWEVPVAFVVRSNGSEITEDEIKQHVSKQVKLCRLQHHHSTVSSATSRIALPNG
ncbi:hypothetical protein MUK42_28649 [Musa troglodytarum]|uniref:AMP-binding enzyme C-terminal domain-containing protein n=1 Tax=Musa troglodytarum TaxID=320322 RepID=A0A9E7GUS0_9LILI|nr:hypothetical protein MUK42_28649 [Musa troglodytarum]